MDEWGRMHETDAQSQLESPLLRQEQAGLGWVQEAGCAIFQKQPGSWGRTGSQAPGLLVPGLTRCPHPSPRCALLSEHGTGGLRWCDALPLINARLLPSCDSLSISVATRLFRKGNRHESVGLKVVILYRVAQKA